MCLFLAELCSQPGEADGDREERTRSVAAFPGAQGRGKALGQGGWVAESQLRNQLGSLKNELQSGLDRNKALGEKPWQQGRVVGAAHGSPRHPSLEPWGWERG